MKKIISLLLTLAACLTLTVSALAAGPSVNIGNPWSGGYYYGPWNGDYTYGGPVRSGYVYGSWTRTAQGMENFRKVRDYGPGIYPDVPAGAWYEDGIRTLYERGLEEGGRRFSPQSRVTLGDVVSLAVLIHRTYNGWAMPEGMSGLQYALNTGIVTADQYDDYTAPATRRSFAAIMAQALPTEALGTINIVMDGVIPDVPMTDPGAPGIYRLYRAGVLVGGDAQGTFHPDGLVTRASAAVIAARMVEPGLRRGTSLFDQESFQVYLDQTSMLLAPGQSGRLTAAVYPVNNRMEQTITWTSSETRTAVVDENGTVTAIHPGTALIIASTPSGTMATCSVKVADSR